MRHWILWIASGLLLIAAAGQFARARRTGKRGWWLGGGLASLAALGLLVSGWLVWSGETAESFIGLVYHRRYDEANRYLSGARWEVGDAGTVRIRAEDGSAVTLAATDQPLASSETTRPALAERLAGRWEFGMGPLPLEARRCTIHFTAARGAVYCRRIETAAVTRPRGEEPPL